MGQPPPFRASAYQAEISESFDRGGVGRGGLFVQMTLKNPIKGHHQAGAQFLRIFFWVLPYLANSRLWSNHLKPLDFDCSASKMITGSILRR